MGFVTGMILALLGAFFILGKLQESSSITSQDARLTVTRASPGIVMALLGVTLMIVTISVNHRIEFSDAPGNLRYFESGASASGINLPDLPPAIDSLSKQLTPKR
jgi:hypothetical protein